MQPHQFAFPEYNLLESSLGNLGKAQVASVETALSETDSGKIAVGEEAIIEGTEFILSLGQGNGSKISSVKSFGFEIIHNVLMC